MNADVPDQISCPKYGSRHLMRDIKVAAHDQTLFAVTFPEPMLRTARCEHQILAAVCGDCGHTDLYVAEHKEMWKAWRQRNA